MPKLFWNGRTEMTVEQYARIESALPQQSEAMCACRTSTFSTRFCASPGTAANGALHAVSEKLAREQFIRIRVEAVALDSAIVKMHPGGAGELKKTVRNPSERPAADGAPRFIWLPQMLERS